MDDPGDDAKLSRHYRDLATETPPAAIDEAIRASARRAVSSAPRRRASRWAMPVSIAAVLFLALGVTLRLQIEEPQVATPALQESAREAYPAPPQATPQPQATPPAQPAAGASRDSRLPADEPLAKPKAPASRAAVADRRDSAESFVAPPPAAAAVAPLQAPVPASPPAAPVPGFAADAPASAEAAAPSRPVAKDAENRARASAAPAQPALAKRAKEERVESLATPAPASAMMERQAPTPERQLEEIATMRREGRHREADEALLKFQREHPGFRIPPETWERVRPSVR